MSVVIATGFTGIAQPIDNPRICFDVAPVDAVVASGSAAGADPDWVTDGETWSVWQGDAALVTIDLDFGAVAQDIDYVAIGAHTLGSTAASVQIRFQLTDGGTWDIPTDIGLHEPDDDGAIVFLFPSRSVFGVRLVIFDGTAAPSIAVFQAGQALEVPRKSVYTGTPITESDQIEYRHQRSIRGDVLGRAVQGAMLEFDVIINNLSETFKAAAGDITWGGFRRHVKDVGPFFIAPKPSSYPADVAYARLVEQPRFERAIPNRNVAGSVTLRCMGYLAI